MPNAPSFQLPVASLQSGRHSVAQVASSPLVGTVCKLQLSGAVVEVLRDFGIQVGKQELGDSDQDA